MTRVVGFRLAAVFGLLLGMVGGPGHSATASSHEKVSVVASGLNNPRGLAFSPNGRLFVAEAGRGAGGISLGPCVPNPAGLEPVCLGQTGSVTMVDFDKGIQRRVVTGMPSLAVSSGSTAIGPADISFGGGTFVAVGLGQHPDTRNALGDAARDLGALLRVNTATNSWSQAADAAAFERERNPDGADLLSKVESNPNGVVADPSGQIVVDAAGNTILSVRQEVVSLLAVLPARTYPAEAGARMETVPVSAVRGPDGALYVGELTGVPFPKGEARVWRIHDGKATVYAGGFTMITDLAFGADGSLYVLEYADNGIAGAFLEDPPGALVRVKNPGTAQPARETLLSSAEGLSGPGGLAVGPDGALYISNHSTDAKVGEVLRFKP